MAAASSEASAKQAEAGETISGAHNSAEVESNGHGLRNPQNSSQKKLRTDDSAAIKDSRSSDRTTRRSVAPIAKAGEDGGVSQYHATSYQPELPSSRAPSPYIKGNLVSIEEQLDPDDYEFAHEGIIRASHLSAKGDLREYLADRSREIFEFISPLEDQIKKVVRARKSSPELKQSMVLRVAELVSTIVRRISQRETGLFTLEPNLPLMNSALLAGPTENSIIEGLYQRAQAVLGSIQRASLASGHRSTDEKVTGLSRHVRSLVDGYDVAREIEELTMLLRWYARRKSSLALVEWQTGVSGIENALMDDSLFGLEVLHDHEVFGVRGCFVCGGLRLIGHDGQALWLRVSAECNGQQVTVRRGWDSWVDSAEESNSYQQAAPFSSLVPIRPNAQRLIIDDVRCFVPYGAFDLPSGKSNVSLVVSLIDQNGEVILKTSQMEEICIPPHADGIVRAASPHSIGMWPHDVVSGDRISNLTVSSGYSQIGHWEQLTVNVTCDLALFMHPGEPVVIECRFSSEDGSLVEVSPQGAVSGDGSGSHDSNTGSYRIRRVIRPRTAWASYTGLSFDVPVDFLYVEPGRHTLMCEVVVLSTDDRILCGDLAAVDVLAPTPLRRDGQNLPVVAASRVLVQPIPSVELESLEVNPAYVFGNGDCVRIQATFTGKSTQSTPEIRSTGGQSEFALPYRVIISLEQADGSLFLQGFSDELGVTYRPATRSVCVEGSGDARESSVVCNFSHREVKWVASRNEQRQTPGKVQVFVRVKALTLDGQIFLDESKEIFIKPEQTTNLLKDIHLGEVRPGIVDAVAATYLQSRKFSARLLLNLPARIAAREGVTVVAFLTAKGKSVRHEVFRSTVAPRHIALWSRAGLELVQVPVEFDAMLESDTLQSPQLDFELVGEFGEVLEQFKQPIQVSEGLTVPESGNGPATPASERPREARPSSDEARAVATSRIPGRRFFAWLAGKSE